MAALAIVHVAAVAAAMAATRSLYPTSKPLSTGRLTVGASGLHSLYYEEHGKADGKPALFLHGGPGAGCFTRHAGFFDPKHYRVVLFDQRGCGKSTPRGELVENTTPDCVADCEALREHLGFDNWSVVLGGSWGSTLALAYANEHPDRIGAIVLRAVCLMRSREIRWLFAPGGIGRLLPSGWKKLAAHRKDRMARMAGNPDAVAAADVVAEDDDSAEDSDTVLRWYARALSGEQPGEIAGAAAAWSRWEMSVYSLGPRLKAETLPSVAEADAATKSAPWVWDPTARLWRAGALEMPSSEARLTSHYSKHFAFQADEALLDAVPRYRHIPCIAVQGGNDLICPPITAYQLHEAWPEMELRVVPGSGHSMYDAGLQAQVLDATDKYRELL